MNSTREKIIEAALRVFSQAGFIGATTKNIAKEAGVNEVTLFRHFGNKEKLFAEVIRNYSAIPHIDAMREKPDASFEISIGELSKQLMQIFEERKDLIALLLSEGPKQSKNAKAILEGGPGQVIRHLTQWFEEAVKSGKIRKVDPECAARAFSGMFFTFLILQIILPGDLVIPIDSEMARSTFIEIFLHGVLPEDKRT